ncbi:MAG: glycosyltransferase family 87 protein [Chloroflexota bacterium]
MSGRWRFASLGLQVAAVIFLLWAWQFAVRTVADGGIDRFAIDAHAYWAVDTGALYDGATIGELDAFLYSPVIGQLLDPMGLLPWPVFYAAWLAALFACLVLLVGPVPAAVLIFVPPIWADITTGNIHLFLAVAIVLGLRWPAAWAVVLLTKITPAVGILWFAARREWRSLAVALGVTVVLAMVSFAFASRLWFDWGRVLTANTVEPPRLFGWPLALRLPVAAAVVLIGGWRGWRWTVPLASTLALPVLWENSVTLLLAIVPLLGLGPLGHVGRSDLAGGLPRAQLWGPPKAESVQQEAPDHAQGG